MKKILVPCDFSDASESALNYAVELSKYLAAELVLLHVDQIPVVSPELSLNTISLQDMRQDSMDALKNLADKITLTRGFNAGIQYISETGSTSQVICEQAKELGIDLVVMGITGHGSKFMKSVVGSASVDVSKKLDVPLIIVPPEVVFKKPENIVYACDFDEHLEDGSSFMKVKYLATLFAADLQVLHIVPDGHKMSAHETSIGNLVERGFENIKHQTRVITEKNTRQGLLDFIHHHQVDLVIIEPRKHLPFHDLFLGSTTNELAFNSKVPVLTIHVPAA